MPMQRLMATIAAILVVGVAPFAKGEDVAVVLDLEGAIGVATAEYIINGIEHAEARDAALVIIRMDSPGGLVNSMRDIVSAPG
jgi:membrane-bound serine protease (ClpP class)